jgi:hypothetical protein
MMLRWFLLWLVSASLSGWCAAANSFVLANRSFQFPGDAFSFANELLWEYQPTPTGRMVFHKRQPKPTYALHCFAVARSARQFFWHARFDPEEPKATRAEYRHLIELVLGKGGRTGSRTAAQVVIPGYANLREFSQAEEGLLKLASGGAWQSYFQRGNWRMVFPFSRPGQSRMAEGLRREIEQGSVPLIHLVCFPSLALNHVLLLFGVQERGDGLEFLAYDPNHTDRPARLTYDRARRCFQFPANNYFAGGPVNVYEIYRGILY